MRGGEKGRNMSSRWIRWITLFSVIALSSCGGSDGGVGGTGISTITGNVAASGSTTADIEELMGIVITIRGTEFRTMTDEHGNFTLEGEFDGQLTLDFRERDGSAAALPVEVPSAGLVSLRNVRFNLGQAEPDQIELTFEAHVISDPDCNDPAGSVEVSDTQSQTEFLLQIDANTQFESESGCPPNAECSDLMQLTTIKIDGTLVDGDTIDANRIRLVTCRPPGRGRLG